MCIRDRKESVPETLLDLLPYAEFWWFIDDSQRQELVSKASREVLSDLKERVSVHDEELDSWLGGPEAQSPNPSNAYLAFSAMRMVADLSVQK